MKQSTTDVMDRFFRDRGWETLRGGREQPEFLLVAENQVALAFLARTKSEDLGSKLRSQAAAVAAFLSNVGGPKVWEGYLIVLVDGLVAVAPEDAAAFERDLTYCRRLLLDSQRIELDPAHAEEYLEQELAMLFPLEDGVRLNPATPEDDLISELVRNGNDEETVRSLIHGYMDPKFDPSSLLQSAGETGP